MSIDSITGAALSGLNGAATALETSATRIAQASLDPIESDRSDPAVKVSISPEARAASKGDLASNLVSQAVSARNYEANLATLRMSDELMRTLLALGVGPT